MPAIRASVRATGRFRSVERLRRFPVATYSPIHTSISPAFNFACISPVPPGHSTSFEHSLGLVTAIMPLKERSTVSHLEAPFGGVQLEQWGEKVFSMPSNFQDHLDDCSDVSHLNLKIPLRYVETRIAIDIEIQLFRSRPA